VRLGKALPGTLQVMQIMYPMEYIKGLHMSVEITGGGGGGVYGFRTRAGIHLS